MGRSRWESLALAGFAVWLAVLTGCGGGGPREATGGATKASGSQAVRGGTLRVGLPSDVPSFLDWNATREHELEVIALVFQPLAAFDRQSQELIPVLAQSWMQREGGRIVEFALRPEARWEDGVPVTARDVVFTHRMQVAPEIDWVRRREKERIERVEAIDERTVRFVFRGAAATNLLEAAAGNIYPAHLLESYEPGKLADPSLPWKVVGSGPFRLGRREAGQAIELVASDTTAGAHPNIDRLLFRIVPDKEARGLMVESGELDLLRAATVEQFERLTASGKFEGFEARVPKYLVIVWNSRRPPLNDRRVRRALALGLDRVRMVELTQRGRGALCNGPLPLGSWANWGAAPHPPDPAAAKALLEQAGFDRVGSDGIRRRGDEPLEVTLAIPAGSRGYGDLAELIRRDVESLGVRLVVQPVEGAVLFEEMAQGKGSAWLIAETAEDKVDLTNLAHSSQTGPGGMNYSGYANPAFDAVCEKAVATVARDAARPGWIEAQKILDEDQPYTFLFFRPDLHVVSTRVKGVTIDSSGLFFHVTDWWIPEAAGG